MVNRLPITVRLDRFEGPLDLLLYLIQSHELDVSKVSISQITDQYLAYVQLMQELNFDLASEFLVMAATLLHWKSKALLPADPSQNGNLEGDDDNAPLTQDELIRQLLEHKRFRDAGQALAELPQLGEEIFCRANSKPPIERVWREMQMTSLATIYQDILVRARKRTQVLKKETVSLADKILEFAEVLKLNQPTELRTFLHAQGSTPEIVATFLAALELSRLKKMRIYQEGVYTPIWLELLEDLQGFDTLLATGFDAERVREEVAEPQQLGAG